MLIKEIIYEAMKYLLGVMLTTPYDLVGGTVKDDGYFDLQENDWYRIHAE